MPNQSAGLRRTSWGAVALLIVAVAALALWHTRDVQWLRWRSNASLIAALRATPHATHAFDLQKELARRIRAEQLSDGERQTLTDLALDLLAAMPHHAGGPIWPDSILSWLQSAGKLSTTDYCRYFETKLQAGIGLGLFGDGLPTRRHAGVVLALSGVIPAFYRVEIIPDSDRVQTDGKKHRLLGTLPVAHAFTMIQWAGRTPPETIDLSLRIRATPESAPASKAIWEGVLQFSGVAWPSRELLMKDASLVAGKLLYSNFEPSDEPK